MSGQPTLTGTNARERAVIHMMQRRTEATLLDAVASYFHHATPGLVLISRTYQNKAWGEKNRDGLSTPCDLDRVLDKQSFLAGNHFSMADITAFAGLIFADVAKIAIPAELTNLLSWRANVATRPSVKSL